MSQERIYWVGRRAQSQAGSDRGCYYLVLREEGNSVWLSDGARHKLNKLKKKNKKHLRILPCGSNEAQWNKLVERFQSASLEDLNLYYTLAAELRRALKEEELRCGAGR